MGLKFTQKVISCSDFDHYSERLIKQQADRLAEGGYKDAGYEYVSIDVSVAIMNVLLLTKLRRMMGYGAGTTARRFNTGTGIINDMEYQACV